MENASKALLIAGAILLVIAIIAIGMTILNQGTDVVNKTGGQIDAMAVNAHNQQFGTIANGDEISGTRLKSICQSVMSNNNQAKGNKVTDVEVTLAGHTEDDDNGVLSTTNLGSIISNATYKISSLTYTVEGALVSFTATKQ